MDNDAERKGRIYLDQLVVYPYNLIGVSMENAGG